MHYLAKDKFHLNASSEIIVSRLVAALGFAAFAVVQSIYLRDIGFSDSNIGYISAAAASIVVLLSPLVPVILERFSELRIYALSTIGLSLVLVGMASTRLTLYALCLYLAFFILSNLYGNTASIVFKDVSGSKKEYTKSQGLASSLLNLGWVLGPLLGGLTLASFGLNTTLMLAASFMAGAAVILILKPINLKAKDWGSYDTSWIGNVRFFISRKGLVLAYIQRFGVTAWWAYIWTFIPLFMLNSGYSPAAVGVSLALTQVPLFLFEFKTVDFIPKLGYKKIFFGSYSLMTLIVLTTLLTTNFIFIIALLVLGSLALCFLEPICEIFFYEHVTFKEEEKAEPIYYTANSTGSIAMRILASFALALSGETASYIVLAVIMASIALSALQIKKKY